MKNLPSTILTTEEIYTFAVRLKEFLKEAGIDDQFISEILPILIKESEEVSYVLAKTAGSVYTKQVNDKDDSRDKAFVGLRDYIHAYTNSPDDEKAEAAVLLSSIINERGNTLHNLGNAAESAELNLLFNEMDKPAPQQALEKIDGISWYINLKSEQADFEEVYIKKVEVDSMDNLPTTREIRKKISKLINVILLYIDHKTDYFEEIYKPLADKVDELVTNTVSIARARKTRKDNKDEEQ